MGPPQGYFPEPTKRILSPALQNVDIAKELFRAMVMPVVTGSRHLGGFIAERDAETTCWDEKVQG